MLNQFEKDATIFLYGFNQFSIRHVKNMLEQGYRNINIIDMTAASIKIDLPCNVLELKNVDFRIHSEAIYIICLQDGMKHVEVALQLNRLGAKKILFIPLLYYGTYEENSLLRRGYLRFSLGDYTSLEQIPNFSERFAVCNNRVIDKGKDWISFWCEINLLYSMGETELENNIATSLRDNYSRIVKYADMQITKYTPYVELFDYLSGGDIIPENYLSIFCKDDIEEKQRYLQRRKALYDAYEQYYKYEPLMFAESPARVEWDIKGYFHVIDGLHRCHYLINKGYEYVPVVARIEHWKCFTKGEYNE